MVGAEQHGVVSTQAAQVGQLCAVQATLVVGEGIEQFGVGHGQHAHGPVGGDGGGDALAVAHHGDGHGRSGGHGGHADLVVAGAHRLAVHGKEQIILQQAGHSGGALRLHVGYPHQAALRESALPGRAGLELQYLVGTAPFVRGSHGQVERLDHLPVEGVDLVLIQHHEGHGLRPVVQGCKQGHAKEGDA